MDKARMKAIAIALEHFWLRYDAAMRLLEKAQVPNYWEIVENYAEQPENKLRAHDRFLEVTALLQSNLQDSEDLKKLTEALQRAAPKSKPMN
jgi:hypothetical protein